MDTNNCTCECEKKCGQSKLLDQNEVAEMLSVKPRTLEYWRLNGIGPKYVKVGKLVRYREIDINKYICELS